MLLWNRCESNKTNDIMKYRDMSKNIVIECEKIASYTQNTIS